MFGLCQVSMFRICGLLTVDDAREGAAAAGEQSLDGWVYDGNGSERRGER